MRPVLPIAIQRKPRQTDQRQRNETGGEECKQKGAGRCPAPEENPAHRRARNGSRAQLSKPTLSTSVDAAFLCLAISATGRLIGLQRTVGRDGRIDLPLRRAADTRSSCPNTCAAPFRRRSHSISLMAFASFGARFASTTPERFTWVPPPWKVGRITLVASAQGLRSVSLSLHQRPVIGVGDADVALAPAMSRAVVAVAARRASARDWP